VLIPNLANRKKLPTSVLNQRRHLSEPSFGVKQLLKRHPDNGPLLTGLLIYANSIKKKNDRDRLVKAILAADKEIGREAKKAREEKPTRRTALQLAASQGLIEIISMSMEASKGEATQANETAGGKATQTTDAIPDITVGGSGNEDANTAFRLASEKGPEDTIEMTDTDGETALHVAAKAGHKDVVESLLNYFPDISIRDADGYTLLHSAVCGDKEDIVRLLLLDLAAHPSTKNDAGSTPLHTAVKNSNETIVRMLLESHAEISTSDNDGQTALGLASSIGDENIVRLLLQEGADVFSRDECVMGPIHLATVNRHEKIVRMLLESHTVDTGNVINQQTSISHFTPLHLASQDGDTEIVRLLLERKANANIPDFSNSTALSIAAEEGHEYIVELLLSCQHFPVDINIRDNHGDTALHRAAYAGNDNIVIKLLKAGADKSLLNKDNMTAEKCARSQGHGSVIKILLDAKEMRRVPQKWERPSRVSRQVYRT
jgi:ankyrin repeat protein